MLGTDHVLGFLYLPTLLLIGMERTLPNFIWQQLECWMSSSKVRFLVKFLTEIELIRIF